MGKFNLNQILNDASKRAAPGGGGQTAPASRPATIERLSVFDLVPSEDIPDPEPRVAGGLPPWKRGQG